MLPEVKIATRSATRTFDVIVFDLDGVIIDSAEDLVAAVRHSVRQAGSADPGFSFVRNGIGIGARNLLLRSLDEDKKDRVDEAMALFREYYEQNCTNHTVLYPGVRDVLALYGHKKQLALATFKIRAATLKILATLGVREYFDVVVTADDVRRPKPDPECINYIVHALHCDPATVLLVGDTRTDVQTGKNAGIATCAVLYGIGTRDELKTATPDFIIDDIRKLRDIVPN